MPKAKQVKPLNKAASSVKSSVAERQNRRRESNRQTETLSQAELKQTQNYYDSSKMMYESYSAIYHAMDSYINANRESEEESVRETIIKYRETEMPMMKIAMQREQQRMAYLKEKLDKGDEASYFDVDEIPSDELTDQLDDTEADLMTETNADKKSFLQKQKERLMEERTEKQERLKGYQAEFGKAFDRTYEAMNNYSAVTTQMRDTLTSIKELDPSDKDFDAKLQALRDQLHEHQGAADGYEEIYGKCYKDMESAHNSYVSEIGISPKHKMSSLVSAMQTYSDKRREERQESVSRFKENAVSAYENGKDYAKEAWDSLQDNIAEKKQQFRNSKFVKGVKNFMTPTEYEDEDEDFDYFGEAEGDVTAEAATASEPSPEIMEGVVENNLNPPAVSNRAARVAMAEAMFGSDDHIATKLENGRPLPQIDAPSDDTEDQYAVAVV